MLRKKQYAGLMADRILAALVFFLHFFYIGRQLLSAESSLMRAQKNIAREQPSPAHGSLFPSLFYSVLGCLAALIRKKEKKDAFMRRQFLIIPLLFPKLFRLIPKLVRNYNGNMDQPSITGNIMESPVGKGSQILYKNKTTKITMESESLSPVQPRDKKI